MKGLLTVLTIVTFLGFVDASYATSTTIIDTTGSGGLCIRLADGIITCR